MIYDHPPKPFYACDFSSESYQGFDTLDEAVKKAKYWAGEYGSVVYVFETKCSFNTEPEEPEPDPNEHLYALVPGGVLRGRVNPTPEQLQKMPSNWEEIRSIWQKNHYGS